MKLRKAMAVALAGALVLTTFATGTTSEAAKKTKLKTKKVTVFVKGKKKISITGKKAKHKYTFTSKKKKIAKVSKKGVITGVKAGKTTITVKDTWKQKGKKKTKKLGTVKVTVKKKTPVKTKTPAVTPPAVVPGPSQAPAVTPPSGGGNQPGVSAPPENSTVPTPKASKKPAASKPPTPTPTAAPPSAAEQTPGVYKPAKMDEVESVDGVTYDPATGSISVKDVEQFCIPLGYTVQNGHALWVKIKGRMNGENGFRSWMVDNMESKTTLSNQWEAKDEEGFAAPGDFDYTFQLVSESDEVTCILIKGPVWGTNIDDLTIDSIEISYPLGGDEEEPGPGPGEPTEPTVDMDLDKHSIAAESTTTAEVSVSAGQVTDVKWSVEDPAVATVAKDEDDAKKATITGVAAGETDVTAEVKVTVEGKEFTVTAKQALKVVAKDVLVVNASIESAPSEVIVGNSAELKVTVDTGTIESVVWQVEDEAATIETDSVEVAKAVLKAVKVGKVTVSATVTVKKDGKTATDTVKVEIDIIKDPTDIIELDITKNIEIPSWLTKKPQTTIQEDGSVKIYWPEEADDYGAVAWNLGGMDLTGYWCVIESNGAITVEISDAKRQVTQPWGSAPLALVPPA